MFVLGYGGLKQLAKAELVVVYNSTIVTYRPQYSVSYTEFRAYHVG